MPALVDLSVPPPQPRQASPYIQQYDQQRAQMIGEIQAQHALLSPPSLNTLAPGGS